MPQVEAKISRLYEQDAQNIVNLLGDHPMCMVIGAHGSGKSNFLVPRVARLLTDKGVSVVTRDGSEFAGDDPLWVPDQVRNALPKVQRGTVILDEGTPISWDGLRATRNVLALIHEQGYSAIPVFPYQLGKGDEQTRFPIDTWRTAEMQISGFKPPVYDLESKRVDEELAREILLEPNSREPGLDEELIKEILCRVPYNLRILGHFQDWHPKSKEEVVARIGTYFDDWLKITTMKEWDFKNRNLK